MQQCPADIASVGMPLRSGGLLPEERVADLDREMFKAHLPARPLRRGRDDASNARGKLWTLNIETERLELRALTIEQAAVLAASTAARSDGSSAAGYPTPGSCRAAAALAEEGGARAAEGFGIYQMMHKRDGLVVGDVGFHCLPSPKGQVEVGFSVAASCQAQGFATEALLALVAWATARADVHRVVARTDPDNVASQTVLSRAGFIRSPASSDLWELDTDETG